MTKIKKFKQVKEKEMDLSHIAKFKNCYLWPENDCALWAINH